MKTPDTRLTVCDSRLRHVNPRRNTQLWTFEAIIRNDPCAFGRSRRPALVSNGRWMDLEIPGEDLAQSPLMHLAWSAKRVFCRRIHRSSGSITRRRSGRECKRKGTSELEGSRGGTSESEGEQDCRAENKEGRGLTGLEKTRSSPQMSLGLLIHHSFSASQMERRSMPASITAAFHLWGNGMCWLRRINSPVRLGRTQFILAGAWETKPFGGFIPINAVSRGGEVLMKRQRNAVPLDDVYGDVDARFRIPTSAT